MLNNFLSFVNFNGGPKRGRKLYLILVAFKLLLKNFFFRGTNYA